MLGLLEKVWGVRDFDEWHGGLLRDKLLEVFHGQALEAPGAKLHLTRDRSAHPQKP